MHATIIQYVGSPICSLFDYFSSLFLLKKGNFHPTLRPDAAISIRVVSHTLSQTLNKLSQDEFQGKALVASPKMFGTSRRTVSMFAQST
jgi:hypothetical protein